MPHHRHREAPRLSPGRRVLCIAFACFDSLFALGVFGEARALWKTLAALFMHLIPAFVLAGMLNLAWRWE